MTVPQSREDNPFFLQPADEGWAVHLVDTLEQTGDLPDEQLAHLLSRLSPDGSRYLHDRATAVRKRYYGDRVFVRGLIEYTNYCKNDCLYCGLRRSNRKARRYRLTGQQILACCRQGYEAGFRTFVLQGGEDPWFAGDRLREVVREIRRTFPDCAITLSAGERSRESYQALFDAGANRYLLRHETATPAHYAALHPPEMSWQKRMECLTDLRQIGYQVGCGLMVGSPGQTIRHLVADLRFIRQFSPEMCGIGPFIPHRDTPFREWAPGSVSQTLNLLAVIRLMVPRVLLPATTALGTLAPDGRERGILAGANVVMPNLSPADVRGDYLPYDNKLCSGAESAAEMEELHRRISAVGCTIPICRGDPCP